MSTSTLEAPAIQAGRFVQNMPEDVVHVQIGDEHSTLVDRDSLPLIEEYRWRVITGISGQRYVYTKAHGSGIYLHRLIAGTPAGMETDHINGDSLDNRRANLRPATMSQNSANTGKPSPRAGRAHTSRFKGVSWSKHRTKWVAYITVDQRPRNLGGFTTEDEAARAYDAAALEAWGEFAYLNFPKEER